VYTSSFLALPPAGAREPLMANDYQRTKVLALAVAREAAARSVPIITTFPGVLYGPGVSTEGNLVGRLVNDHLDGRLPGIIGGRRIWSYAYVDDVAEAHAAAVERGEPGGEYQLGGENTPQIRLFEILRTAAGTRLPRRIPCTLADLAGRFEERRARATGRLPLLTRGAVAIFRHDWPLDSERSIRDLGFTVRPLAEGVQRVLADLRPGRA
jgi:nucleoside-diphosphate-sugar epimerase